MAEHIIGAKPPPVAGELLAQQLVKLSRDQIALRVSHAAHPDIVKALIETGGLHLALERVVLAAGPPAAPFVFDALATLIVSLGRADGADFDEIGISFNHALIQACESRMKREARGGDDAGD